MCKKTRILIVAVFLSLFASTFSQNATLKQTPVMCLKNSRMNKVMDTLLQNTKGSSGANVIVLSMCKIHKYNYLFTYCVNKGFLPYLMAETEFQSLPLLGYAKILNYDCFIFGDKTVKHFFRQTRGFVQIKKEWSWLTDLPNIQYMDDLLVHLGVRDTTENTVPMFITFDIMRRVYRNGHFIDITSDSLYEELYWEFKNSRRLPYRERQ